MLKNKLKVVEGRSMCNGVILYSLRTKHYYAIATVNDDGEIVTKWTDEKQNEDNKSDPLIKKQTFWYSMAFSGTILALFLNLITLYVLFRIFLVLISIMLLTNILLLDIDTRKFHGAEHVVINAFNKLGRVPSLEEAHNYSRFSYFCGTNHIALISLSLLSIFTSTFAPDINAFIQIINCSCIMIFILYFSGILNLLQNFTTSEPTDKELTVAISALNTWFEHES